MFCKVGCNEKADTMQCGCYEDPAGFFKMYSEQMV